VLDVGCGDGKITAEIADRLPRGAVLGVDASRDMIAFARSHFGAPARSNTTFAVADASHLEYRAEFDLVVSFNALHWVRDQGAALRGIAQALRPAGRAFLEFVPQGGRASLEDVLEETRKSARWAHYFTGYTAPYVHPTPEAYERLAKDRGLRVEGVVVEDKRWDFASRDAFAEFGLTTFVEWIRLLPQEERRAFVDDTLDAYQRAVAETPAEANVFKFYQMEVRLLRP
jgi:trans-aconitate methyltransferase